MIYHAYNRGAHKAVIFHDESDYQRFVQLLYIGNSAKPLRMYNLNATNIFSIARENVLVRVLAYCLMPNHFHVVIQEDTEGTVTKFMRKICTSYSMYYNFKYKHSGTIFQGGSKMKFVENESYLQTLIQYVHLNPYGIEKPNLTPETRYENIEEAVKISSRYAYSSFKDHLGQIRPENVVVTIASQGVTLRS